MTLRTGTKAQRMYLTTEELKAFYAVIPSENKRDALIFRLMSDMGLRVGEVVGEDVYYYVSSTSAIRKDATIISEEMGKIQLKVTIPGLKIEDVDFQKEAIIVHGKGGKTRILKMPTKVRDLLKAVIGPRASGWVILNDRGQQMTPNSVWYLARKYGERAGIVIPVHPHMFRHSFGVHFYQATRDIRALSRKLGHSNIQTTMIYCEIVESLEDDQVPDFDF
ncbi:MAG: tyrosine-type recombinase/integrase [Candidatus Thorarchaeota archaeon]